MKFTPMKTRHINVIKAHIEVAIPFGPEDNLLLLTTQIKEAARKLTGFVDCKTTLGKVPAPAPNADVITIPMVEPVLRPEPQPEDHLAIPAFMARQK